MDKSIHEGKLLRNYIENNGLTMLEAAEKIGKNSASIFYKYFKTKRFTYDVAEILYEGLGFDVHLFGNKITAGDKANTYILDVTASAGFGSILENRMLDELPMVSLPHAPRGTNITIQVVGDSMYPTVGHMDYVAAVRVDHRDDIREGHVYIVVDRDEGVVCKRVYLDGADKLRLVSDNKTYPPYVRSCDDIIGIFRCWMRMSTEFRPHGLGVKEAIERLGDKLDLLIVDKNE